MSSPIINTGSIALIFEGGGMRNAYTAAVVTTLLRHNINFPKVYGISAGASLAVDYVARCPERARAVFTESTRYKQSGGFISFLTGHGFFDTNFVFTELADRAEENQAEAHTKHGAHAGTRQMNHHDQDLPSPWAFNYTQFSENKADVHIEAFNAVSGETQAWTKKDMTSLNEIMKRVAASCAYPLASPDAVIDGSVYIDGGMGTSHGICLDAARRDGFKRFFVVRSQMRSYRMPPLNEAKKALYRVAYARYPKVYEAIVARPKAYNALLDEIDQLASEGQVYLFCPKVMPITYMTKDYSELIHTYELGVSQCEEELNQWKDWIG